MYTQFIDTLDVWRLLLFENWLYSIRSETNFTAPGDQLMARLIRNGVDT
jgi:hypothetical protein